MIVRAGGDISRVLVTGGNGQLGRAFASMLQEGWAVGRSECDVTDRLQVAALVSARSPDVVINAAAFTMVDAAEAEPEEAYRVNVLGAKNVAQAAESVGAAMVQVSTDYVYPGTKSAPYSEEDETGPLSVYGKTKLEGESAAMACCSRTLVVRTSWVFGEGRNFIRSILDAVAGGRSEVTVVSDQYGRPTYAPDLARGILRLFGQTSAGTFHLTGSGPAVTWADLAESALETAGLSATVRRVTTAEYAASRSGPLASRPRNSVLDCSRAADLGVELPQWRQSVGLYVKELRAG